MFGILEFNPEKLHSQIRSCKVEGLAIIDCEKESRPMGLKAIDVQEISQSLLARIVNLEYHVESLNKKGRSGKSQLQLFEEILVKDGKLTGLVGGDMMFSHSKGDMLERLQNILGVTQEETLVCGDGANDLSMFAHAGTRVAFCARDILKKEATIIIEKKDLTQILEKTKGL